MPNNENSKYVLFVRHCFACHNKGITGFDLSREPLCTKEGILQSIFFGRNLDKVLDKTVARRFNNIELFSSVLPRAMETAKLISYGYETSKKKNKRRTIEGNITRVNFVQEKAGTPEKKVGNVLQIGKPTSWNRTYREKSNNHAKFLNKVLDGVRINEKEILGSNPSETTFIASNNHYRRFVEEVVPELNPNTLSIIVSHGKFLRESIPIKKFYPEFNKMNNLDAILIKYSKKGQQMKGLLINDRLARDDIRRVVGGVFKGIKTINWSNVVNQKKTQKIFKRLKLDDKFSTCTYKYNRDILPISQMGGKKTRRKKYKKNRRTKKR